VVFAEDIPDIPSTDVPSGKSVCFCQSRGDYAKFSFKMRGLPCVLNIIVLLMGLMDREICEMSGETIMIIPFG
jgi:hypothetical protein